MVDRSSRTFLIDLLHGRVYWPPAAGAGRSGGHEQAWRLFAGVSCRGDGDRADTPISVVLTSFKGRLDILSPEPKLALHPHARELSGRLLESSIWTKEAHFARHCYRLDALSAPDRAALPLCVRPGRVSAMRIFCLFLDRRAWRRPSRSR